MKRRSRNSPANDAKPARDSNDEKREAAAVARPDGDKHAKDGRPKAGPKARKYVPL